MKTNGSKQTKQTEKEPYIPELFDKPMVQEIEAGIPLSVERIPEGYGDPALYDKEHCGSTYTVEDEKYYQIRLGIHSCSLGIGSMDKDSAVVCAIPTKSAEVQRLMALFFIPEIDPVRFLDAVFLKASQPFRLEYVLASARLESNSNSGGVILGEDAVELIDDEIVIIQNGLEDLIPDYCTFHFDFLSFQVKVIFDNLPATK